MIRGKIALSPPPASEPNPELPFIWEDGSGRAWIRTRTSPHRLIDVCVFSLAGDFQTGEVTEAVTATETAWKARLGPNQAVTLQNG